MINCKIEQLSDALIEELTPVLEKHRVELQSHEMRLNPDWDTYKAIDKLGKLVWIIARDDDGELLGYSLYIVNYNLHYQDYIYAIEDVFYVTQDKRGSRVGVALIRESERVFYEMGVNVITHHAKFINRFAEFLEKLGYKKTEVMLAKRIRDE